MVEDVLLKEEGGLGLRDPCLLADAIKIKRAICLWSINSILDLIDVVVLCQRKNIDWHWPQEKGLTSVEQHPLMLRNHRSVCQDQLQSHIALLTLYFTPSLSNVYSFFQPLPHHIHLRLGFGLARCRSCRYDCGKSDVTVKAHSFNWLHGWGMEILDHCLLCRDVDESMSHLFLNCKHNQQVWDAFSSRTGKLLDSMLQ